MTGDIRKLLGLKADASDEEIQERIADLGERAHEADGLKTKLAAEIAEKETATSALSSLRTEREKEQADERKAEIEKLDADARARGLWEPGSARAKLFGELAASNIKAARDYIGTLNPVTQVGAASQSRGTEPAKGATDSVDSTLKSEYGLDDLGVQVVKQQLAQMGVSNEKFLQSGDHARDKREEQPGHDWLAAIREGA